MQAFDPYSVLGLPRTATPDAIKSAYRQSARLTHPDRGGEPAAFIVVVKAFGVLADPEARRLFDETGMVDEEGARSYRQEVVVILADMFDTAVRTALELGLPLDRVDFIQQMTVALIGQSNQATDRCATLDMEIEALTSLRGRIKRQDENPNLFVQRLNEQVTAKVKDHTAVRRRLALFESAAAELANYDSEVELFSALEME
jgi:curved DNA-binding protein CbpA